MDWMKVHALTHALRTAFSFAPMVENRQGRNRPLSRSVVKIGARLLWGKSRAHVQDWFPGLKLDRSTATGRGTIYYRGKKVGELAEGASMVPPGLAKILIIGSGPSVNRCDLMKVGQNPCILLNGALHLMKSAVAQPLAVAIEDERFVWKHFDLIRKIPLRSACLLSVSVIRAICQLDETWLQGRPIVLIDNIRKPYLKPRRNEAELETMAPVVLADGGVTGFSKDPVAGVFQGGSVVVSALQFAVSWRPHEIGLLGIDLSNADKARFYETAERTYSGVRRAQDRILDHLVLAKAIAADAGIQVVNHSPISALNGRGFGYDASFAKPD